MLILRRGRHAARLAETAADLDGALSLRALCFRDGKLTDGDRHDRLCRHVLVEDTGTGRLLCTFRLLPLASGRQIGRSYAAQHYDLSPLHGFEAPMVELGRFCIRPGDADPDILRVAWGALTGLVERENVGMVFGCSSFRGIEPSAHGDAFALLRDRHLAPVRWLPRVKAPDVFRFALRVRRKADPQRALRAMPPLLRSYLAMGGWVGDHAVVDRDLGTLHVFTGLETRAVPPARKRLLRAIAG